MDLVCITWNDAHTLGNEEIAPADIDEQAHFPYLTHSCGYMIRSDDIGVTLATDVQVAPDGQLTYRNVHFVPRGMVASERVIRGARKVKK